MKRIDYNQIREALHRQLDDLSPRRTSRTLDSHDLEALIDALKRARRKHPHADRWRVTIRGGYVPNSYRYRAECDEATIDVLATGYASALVGRVRAQSRRHGQGNLLLVRIDGRPDSSLAA